MFSSKPIAAQTHQDIQMTNPVASLETFQSRNEIKNPISASNGYQSFRYWPLLAAMRLLFLQPGAVQYKPTVWCTAAGGAPITETGERVRSRHLAGLPFSTLWVFFRGNWNISSRRNRCNKREIAVDRLLKVKGIETRGKPVQLPAKAPGNT